MLFGAFPPVGAACSNAPGRPRRGKTSRFHAGRISSWFVGWRVGSERREIIREREELRPGGGTPRSERRTGGEPLQLLEERTVSAPISHPNRGSAHGECVFGGAPVGSRGCRDRSAVGGVSRAGLLSLTPPLAFPGRSHARIQP